MKVSIPCAAALALFPLVSAFPVAPNAARGEQDITKYGRGALEARELRIRQSAPVSLSVPSQPSTTAKSTSAAASTSAESTAPPPPASTTSTPPSTTSAAAPSTPPPPQSTSTTPSSTPTSVTPIVHTTASKTQIASTDQNGQVTTVTSEVVISFSDTPTPSPSDNPPSTNPSPSGVSNSTVIGLSVAGGLAALGAIAFIAWKLTRKRFSQFDADDGVINWPDLQKDPAVVAPRPAPSTGAASITGSTVDLVKDPYAVPPLPQNNGGGVGPYRDDGSGFYDPYRGPIPQTFSTPPTSTDGHQQGWAGGEAIPMSTYASGRTSPGPNYAYGGGIVDPMQRTGTPVQRMATPVQRMATPVGGAATFHEIARGGTPGAVPYRTGTPGYGYGGR